MKYYDTGKKRLVCIEEAPTPSFWDGHWDINDQLIDNLRRIKKNFVVDITRKYLSCGSGMILEGGCGTGINVAALVNNGYKCIGVDYARRTIDALNRRIPELDIHFADVKKLPFDDSFFIGYWSWGVIEHFYQGYSDIISEAGRVLKKGGYLFLVFPEMSVIRKLKAMMGKYDPWRESSTDKFYQFMLNRILVIKDCQKLGFVLVKAVGFDGLKGAKNELSRFQKPLHKLYSYNGQNILFKALRKGLDAVLSPIAGHSSLLILKKR